MQVPNETDSLMATRPAAATRFPPLATLIRDGVVLANEGSTARDHLANERTYLAWMRTSLALIGASLGILKWSAVTNTVGYLVAVLGVVVLITSTQRYFRVMQLLEQGKFEPNVTGVLCIVVVVVAAIVTAFSIEKVSEDK